MSFVTSFKRLRRLSIGVRKSPGAKSVSNMVNSERWKNEAYGRDPFFTTTTHSRPVVIPQLCTAFLVRTDDPPRHLAVFEEELHPFHLTEKARISISSQRRTQDD